MDKIYHGCMKKNADGSNKLIGPGQKFFVPTADCFQKNPSDVKHCKVKTRSHTKKEPTVSIKDYDNLFQTEGTDQSMDTQNKFRRQLILLFVVFFLVLFIVNNGNILTDGINERKYNTVLFLYPDLLRFYFLLA